MYNTKKLSGNKICCKNVSFLLHNLNALWTDSKYVKKISPLVNLYNYEIILEFDKIRTKNEK